ncbi:YfhO family protein [Ruminococcus flavefaciens]|uniref:YfhO family protein n=1 Tax=Ruminococcus flavefaciens TaxID=1265 RepID=UPI0026EC765F|nr:YfhO family protein [Ruminococcus flavefaciens]
MKKSFGNSRSYKEKYLSAFLIGFLALLLTTLPMMVTERGYFIYFGDFNAQQIPFYSLANDAVRSGSFGWNWFTDLGSDFMTSYSFYLFGSPFFWLTTLLPRKLVIYSIPFLLAVKHGMASLTAYIYIRRFVRGKNAALTGALLYAFSGFQVYNIFFNHFQDVTALFPLTLIAMEENINCRRKGVFALSVALMACVNYYFFAGQAVFLVLYYLFRMRSSDFHTSWKKFFMLILEAVLGSLMAAFILLPSAMALMGNYRISEHAYGADMIGYTDKTLIPRIIQSFFMPSDPPAYPNLFRSDFEKWASIGGYLPLFSMVGVLSFLRMHKKHWASRLLICCVIFAFIPVLNSLFQAANSYYYARWFYMPILIMAMMTAHTLDNEGCDCSFGLRFCAVMLGALAVIGVLPRKPEDDKKAKLFSMPEDIPYFWLTLSIAVVFLILTFFIMRRKKKGTLSTRFMVLVTAGASVICIFTTSLYGANTIGDSRNYISSAIEGGSGVCEKVTEDNFFRIDISEDCDNYPMLWELPSMRAFQSVVCTSIMDFYSFIGIQRDVASRPELSNYALRGLFSVKYYYKEKAAGCSYKELLSASRSSRSSSSSSKASAKDGEDTSRVIIPDELPSFKYIGENDHFEIYENELFIPMGFGYDQYVTKSSADNRSKLQRQNILMKALVLSDEQAEKYSDILSEYTFSDALTLSRSNYSIFCSEKRKCCSKSFTFDSHGFTSVIGLSKPQLVFFSVPYSKGWTAEVNGVPADVERVDEGFMAVRANAGENTIVFRYETPYLRVGLIISLCSAAVLAAYVLIFRRRRGKNEPWDMKHYYDYTSCEKIRAADEYCDSLFKKER